MIFIAADVFLDIIFALKQPEDEVISASGMWQNPPFVYKEETYVSFYGHVLHQQFKRCIIYNLDSDELLYRDEFFLHNLRKAQKIYDFSLRNVREFARLGIQAEWKPILWHPTFEYPMIQPIEDRNVDFLFLGTTNIC